MDYILNFQWNGLMGILLYWVPLLFCMVFYSVLTAQNWMAERIAREKHEAAIRKKLASNSPYTSPAYLKYYSPSLTLGTILGRALVSIIPVTNIWAALFDLAPKVFGRLFQWIGEVFSQPLVPKRLNGDGTPAKGSS